LERDMIKNWKWKSQSVLAIFKNGSQKEYSSMTIASIELNIDIALISNCCKWKQLSSKWIKFKLL